MAQTRDVCFQSELLLKQTTNNSTPSTSAPSAKLHPRGTQQDSLRSISTAPTYYMTNRVLIQPTRPDDIQHASYQADSSRERWAMKFNI